MRKLDSLYITKVRKFMSRVQEILQGLLVPLCPVIKVNEKLQWSKADSITKGTDSSGMKVRTTSLGKKTRAFEVIRWVWRQ